ncbi:hypothetical protein [Paenibacillus aceris]|uniref:Uncharacterized protein n=1 Tax=Paenibacillus aceris TaxID=869555 RepID=A0ABS4IAA6_9BACL|nr:hypothetical protein [Paenibacillus aceris]MBP1967863.1 hypothetical protein [Paenibacillus aceris]NHW39052.1 hypothetical protein [Paenibacillus aceris]
MMKRFVCIWAVIVMLTAGYNPVYAADGAEAFDIEKGEVIKSITHSASLQSEVGKWLSAIAGPVGSLNIEPTSGIAVKVELAPPLKINNQWVSGTVTQVVLFVSQSPSYTPKLLIFTKENEVVAVTLKYNFKRFLKSNDLYRPQLNLSIPN